MSSSFDRPDGRRSGRPRAWPRLTGSGPDGRADGKANAAPGFTAGNRPQGGRFSLHCLLPTTDCLLRRERPSDGRAGRAGRAGPNGVLAARPGRCPAGRRKWKSGLTPGYHGRPRRQSDHSLRPFLGPRPLLGPRPRSPPSPFASPRRTIGLRVPGIELARPAPHENQDARLCPSESAGPDAATRPGTSSATPARPSPPPRRAGPRDANTPAPAGTLVITGSGSPPVRPSRRP